MNLTARFVTVGFLAAAMFPPRIWLVGGPHRLCNGTDSVPINVQQDGGKLNLYRYLTLDGGAHLRWKVNSDISVWGTLSAEHNNQKGR